ncbi:MAG TPA: bifunctional diaminohydroxyphosphoribosylaminopyrimidine deaminase/5-amino-6-(5-phosphoribosylamino)uracil reductase RibD [bacterium]
MSDKNSEKFMRLALGLAKRAKNRTLPNPMVGAIVVKHDRIIGRGYHKEAGGPHAEVIALGEAGEGARNATLYVNLEPCNHWGRTPPCTDAILQSGIKRVVVGMIDPNQLVKGKGISRLRKNAVEVESGVLEDECRKLNQVYIKNITKKMPYVIFKSAVTLDGRTATKTGDSKWITSPDSRRLVHNLRAEVDAVMVGIGTVLKDDSSLTTHGVASFNPLRIIVDSKLRIPLRARVLTDTLRKRTVIATTERASKRKADIVAGLCGRLIFLPSNKGRVDLKALLLKLYSEGICRLLVEGGATLGGSLFSGGFIDRMLLFIAPMLVGDGIGIFEGSGLSRIRYSKNLKDVKIKKYGKNIIVEGSL